MEPGMSPDQMAARLVQLRQEADRAMAAFQNRVAATRQMQDQAADVTGEASSGDGRVRAAVDSTGVVTSLTFAPSLFDATTPDRLATTVVATIQAAAAQARARIAEAVDPIRPGDAPAGVPELRELRIGVPQAPVTASDPTLAQDEWHDTAPQPPARQPSDDDYERPW